MRSEEKLLSIITPTYNRGKLLQNCYQSLKEQSSQRFEWIIVDDGSTDDTEKIVEQFQSENPKFPIIYTKKENGGKHTALNESHKHIHGDYVLILDSDDTLTEDAVEQVFEGWGKYGDNESIGIVIFLKGKSKEDPIAYVKDEYVAVDLLRYQRVCIYGNDCCEVIRTDLFRKYPFPVYDGERFMSEGVLWHRVALTHQCVYINKIIYLGEYLENGLTKSGRAMRIRNPYGGMLNSEMNMSRRNLWRDRLKGGLLYVCYGFFAGLSPVRIVKHGDGCRILKAICMIPGYFMYRLWKRRYS